MNYRFGTREDGEYIYNLISDMEQKNLPYDYFMDIYAEQQNNDNYRCLVCEDGKNVVGVLNLRFERQLHHCSGIAEIMEFAVADAYRGQGIGKEMFARACDTAREAGCTQIEVACNQLRKSAHRFYGREGMKNFHYKFSLTLTGEDMSENVLGR